LEIIDVFTNILTDLESDPDVVIEKRRYIQSFVECITNLDTFLNDEPVNNHKLEIRETLQATHQVSWTLGFLVAEYKSKFVLESIRSKGQKSATKARSRDGKKRRNASLDTGNEVLKSKPELIIDLPKLAKLIEGMQLPDHKQRNGAQIAWEAIAIHLREGLKMGKLKNS